MIIKDWYITPVSFEQLVLWSNTSRKRSYNQLVLTRLRPLVTADDFSLYTQRMFAWCKGAERLKAFTERGYFHFIITSKIILSGM